MVARVPSWLTATMALPLDLDGIDAIREPNDPAIFLTEAKMAFALFQALP